MNTNNVARGFIPEIWDASVYRTLEDNLVLKKVCRAPIDKPPKGFGDTIYFTGLADPSITAYTGTLSAEALNDDQIAMLIDKTKTFCFSVQDVDKLMANVDLQGSQTERAAYALKDAVEKDAFQYIPDFAAAGTAQTATVTSGNAISAIAEMASALYTNNVKENNMFVVIPPWVMLKLKMAGIRFSINEGTNGKGGMFWTNDLGFDTYVTNTVYNSSTTPVSVCFAGSYQAIGYTDLQLPTRTIELSGSRATQVDGGLVYGYKVIKPKELIKATFTYQAESSTI